MELILPDPGLKHQQPQTLLFGAIHPFSLRPEIFRRVSYDDLYRCDWNPDQRDFDY